MTTVHISLGRDDGTDQTAAKGVVEWEPTTRREDGTMVILERGFTVPLVAGEATVTVDPSGLTWCWRVTERTDSGGTVRYVSVPDSAVTVEYVDLPDVDPTTLVAWSPADPEAAYQTALDNLDVETAVETYLLANPVSAPVSSVNGKVGAVTLDADDVGADPAGTAAGLVGALVIPDSPDDIGAASAAHTHAPEDVTGTAVITTDARLSDARTPLAHSHTLADVTDTGGAAVLDVGTTAGTVAAGDHAHTGVYAAASHEHTALDIDAGASLDGQVLTSDGAGNAAWETPASGVTDHGLLNGLADDDHTQYALADGTRGMFAATSHTHAASQISDSTVTGRALITAATATAARTAISAAPALGSDDNYVTDAEKVVIGNTSGTNTGDQDLSGLAPLSGQFAVNTVAASGATETIPATHAAHKVTMDQACTFTFTSPTAGHAFVLHLLGAFTPTFPASVDWAGGTAPTYASGTLYHFVTLDGGTSWLGSGQAYS